MRAYPSAILLTCSPLPIGSVLAGVMSDEVTDDDRTDGSLEGEEHGLRLSGELVVSPDTVGPGLVVGIVLLDNSLCPIIRTTELRSGTASEIEGTDAQDRHDGESSDVDGEVLGVHAVASFFFPRLSAMSKISGLLRTR